MSRFAPQGFAWIQPFDRGGAGSAQLSRSDELQLTAVAGGVLRLAPCWGLSITPCVVGFTVTNEAWSFPMSRSTLGATFRSRDRGLLEVLGNSRLLHLQAPTVPRVCRSFGASLDLCPSFGIALHVHLLFLSVFHFPSSVRLCRLIPVLPVPLFHRAQCPGQFLC